MRGDAVAQLRAALGGGGGEAGAALWIRPRNVGATIPRDDRDSCRLS